MRPMGRYLTARCIANSTISDSETKPRMPTASDAILTPSATAPHSFSRHLARMIHQRAAASTALPLAAGVARQNLSSTWQTPRLRENLPRALAPSGIAGFRSLPGE